jgi:hypothetical protein
MDFDFAAPALAEIQGKMMNTFLTALRQTNIDDYSEEYGFISIENNGWYALRPFLAMLDEITHAKAGNMFDLVSFGMKVADLTAPDANQTSFESFIQKIDQVYTTHHRGEGMGDLSSQFINERHVEIISRTPYPDDYEYGLFYQYAKRLLPRGSHFIMRYKESEPRRKRGGARTIYRVTWE